MSQVEFAVYQPPRPGLPFLAIEILADGTVNATPYESQGEADAHGKLVTRTLKEGSEDDRSGLGTLLP